MVVEDLTYKVIGCCMEVHTQLGPGLLEACYWLVRKLVNTSLSIDVASMTTVGGHTTMHCSMNLRSRA